MTMLIYSFCKSCEPEPESESEIVFRSKNKTKTISGPSSSSQHVNNQTNRRIALEKLKKIWICLVFNIHLPVLKNLEELTWLL